MNPFKDARLWVVAWLCFILPGLALNLGEFPPEQQLYAIAITFICADRIRRDVFSLLRDILKK